MNNNVYLSYIDICNILDIPMRQHSKFKDIKINKLSYYLNECDEHTLFIHYHKSASEFYLINQALDKGCLVITASDVSGLPDDAKIIKVGSVLSAVQKLAKVNREKLQSTIVAVTGSVGKSSVKELTSQILSAYGSTYSILKNENGTLGINTILANIPVSSKFAVVEVSASGPKSIEPRAKPIQAEIGIVTNAAYNHMVKYSNANELRKEKLDLLRFLTGRKIAIVSRKLFDEDLENENFISTLELGRVITVGEHEGDDIQLLDYKLSAIDTYATIRVNNETYEIFLPLPGKHLIETAMFSLAVVLALNLDINIAINQCHNYIPPARRNQRFKVSLNSMDRVELIDDAINASPTSVNAMLEIIKIRKNIKRKVLIFGDMLELGSDDVTEKLHLELVDSIKDAGIDYLITIGKFTKKVADAIGHEIKVDSFPSVKEAQAAILSLIQKGDLIIVKGSGAMKLAVVAAKVKGAKGQYQEAGRWTIESESLD